MKSLSPLAAQRRYRSFTLVEMLVAVAVLSLMILAMAQMTQLVSRAWREGRSRVDNFTQSRATLDLVIGDLQRGVFRSDVPSFLVGATNIVTNGATYFGNGTFTNAFFTRTAGVPAANTTSVRDLSLVDYYLDTTNKFQRADLPVTWAAGDNQIPFGNDSSTNGGFGALLSDVTAREEAPGVVGFMILFRHQDGTITPSSAYTGEEFTTGNGVTVANPVTSIGVALAVVGEQALGEMSAAQLSQLAGQLAKVSVTTSAKSAWDQAMTTQFESAPGAYPKALGTSFKTFERWVNCQPF